MYKLRNNNVNLQQDTWHIRSDIKHLTLRIHHTLPLSILMKILKNRYGKDSTNKPIVFRHKFSNIARKCNG